MASTDNARHRRVVTFGEAMVRYAPVSSPGTDVPDSNHQIMLQSVGGDELNVCVALATLGDSSVSAQWISVLPSGPMGDVVYRSGESTGVDMSLVKRIENADVGTFYVLPEHKTVHYQRRHSAFALHDPSIFDWEQILQGDDIWMHMTGITPMVSEQARMSWVRALEAAHARGIPVSMDFNHRKQLGTLEQLWTVMLPQLRHLEVIILSIGSMCELAVLEGQEKHVPPSGVPLDDPRWFELMATLRHKWKVKRLAVCFKTRDETGLQRRWSAIADAKGVHTTIETPTYHRPKDECGGGSAWAAGIIHRLSLNAREMVEDEHAGESSGQVATTVITESLLTQAAHRGDIFAALCQETVGDHSQATLEDLLATEATATKAAVRLDQSSPLRPAANTTVLDDTLAKLKTSGVLGIIRAKDAQIAIKRGKELVDLGCRAIEVTLDTDDWRRVLQALSEYASDDVVVGVGTVMDKDVPVLAEIARLGGKFALSPIEPKGFIEACHRLNILAVPAGLSSNELWDMHRRGARVIKLFHAKMVTPPVLKSMLGVSPLRQMNIAPSGGVSPDNVTEWWDAGACFVGMGSNLSGKDLSAKPGTDAFDAGTKAWKDNGRDTARSVFDLVKTRFPRA